MTGIEIKDILDKQLPGAVTAVDDQSTPDTLIVASDQLVAVCQLLLTHKSTYFDMLSCLTGIDNGPESNTMEVAYTLYSIPYNCQVMIRVELSRQKPELPSVHDVWKTALWHEREAYDLLGIVFTGHPDLRRILLPADWEGHPLRKDYQHQDSYRGIKVAY